MTESQTLVVQALIPEHVTAVKAAVAASHAENTTSTYKVGMRSWERFCARFGYTVFPATPESFAAWLISLADEGKAPSTISTYQQSVLDLHRANSCADLLNVEGVRRATMGLRRSQRSYEPSKARALTVNEITRMVAASDSSLLGIRNRAWLLLSTAAGLRFSDSNLLERRDIRFVDGRGLVVKIRWSKTDQSAVGIDLPIPSLKPEHANIDAVVAIRALLAVLPEGEEQALFPGVFRGGYTFRSGRISNQGANLALNTMAKAAGVETDGLTTHSCRSSFATGAYSAEVSELAISRTGRWASLTQQRSYVRVADADLFSDIASDWTQRVLTNQ